MANAPTAIMDADFILTIGIVGVEGGILSWELIEDGVRVVWS